MSIILVDVSCGFRYARERLIFIAKLYALSHNLMIVCAMFSGEFNRALGSEGFEIIVCLMCPIFKCPN